MTLFEYQQEFSENKMINRYSIIPEQRMRELEQGIKILLTSANKNIIEFLMKSTIFKN